jgi:hypothetical protein
MTRINRRGLIAAIGATTLGACSGQLQLGEGKRKPEGGIGGTGIVGTLTDFGSLVVNGLRVELDGSTVLSNAYGSVEEGALTIGQSLTIEASEGQGGLFARRVHLTHPVIGRVSFVSDSGNVAIVAGVRVRPEEGMIGSLVKDARVAVSGVWRGGEVVASRIDLLKDVGPSALAGVVGRSGDGSNPTVGTRKVAIDSSFLPPSGSFTTLVWKDDRISTMPDDVVPNRFTGSAGPLKQLSVEGYLDPSPEPPSFSLAGLGHSFDSSAKLEAFRDKRGLFSGPYSGTFDVAEGVVMPNDFNARRELSRDLLRGGLRPTLPVR